MQSERRPLRIVNRVALAMTAALLSILFAPALLAFPYRAEVGGLTVRSERPIDPAIARVVARANALLAAGPTGVEGAGTQVFLTDGGWRWRLLAVRYGGAFALSRPLTEPLIFNRSDVAADRVYGRGTAARSLSGTLAHERCHGALRHRYGLLATERAPRWLVEGSCDAVARESALTAARAERLRRTDPGNIALAYYDGRRRVEAALAAGKTLDQLFAEAR